MCTCYTTSNAQYFLYHKFHDFRFLAREDSDFKTPPPLVTVAGGKEESRDSSILASAGFLNDWAIQSWGKPKDNVEHATYDRWNSPQNVYISMHTPLTCTPTRDLTANLHSPNKHNRPPATPDKLLSRTAPGNDIPHPADLPQPRLPIRRRSRTPPKEHPPRKHPLPRPRPRRIRSSSRPIHLPRLLQRVGRRDPNERPRKHSPVHEPPSNRPKERQRRAWREHRKGWTAELERLADPSA